MTVVLEKSRAFSADKSMEEVYSKIRRMAHWHCSLPDDVDDVTQEAALRIWMNGGLKDGLCRRPSAWMNAIVRNAAIDLYQKLARENRSVNRSFDLSTGRSQLDPDGSTREVAAPDDVAELVERRLLRQRVLYALKEMKPEYRQALLMVAEGRSYLDVACEQQIPVGTARSRIFHARRRMQELVAE